MTLARALLGVVQLGIDVYVCDPRSPWQRGSNENANRLLRHYLTKAAELCQLCTRDLDNITNRINTRSRRVPDWATSAELFWPRVRARYRVRGSAYGQCGQPFVLHKPAGPGVVMPYDRPRQQTTSALSELSRLST